MKQVIFTFIFFGGLFLFAASFKSYSQDSVLAKVTHVKEKTIWYTVNKMKFVSVDCKCGLKRGDYFKIPRSRFDSLLRESKPVRKKEIEN